LSWKAEAVFDEITASQERVSVLAPMAEALALVAQAVAKAGDFDRVVSLAERSAHLMSNAHHVESPERRSRLLPVLAESLATAADAVITAGDVDMAAAVARAIPDHFIQAMALGALSKKAASYGDIDRAEVLAGAIASHYYRSEALTALARVVAAAGDAHRSSLLAESAEKAVDGLTDHYWLALALAQAAAAVGDIARSVALAGNIADAQMRDRALVKLAQTAAAANDIAGASVLVYRELKVFTRPARRHARSRWRRGAGPSGW